VPDSPQAKAPASPEDDAFVRRVVYALLGPAARLARRFSIPAGDLQDWVRMAYFQEYRALGLTVAEACARIGVSTPTGARISKQLKTFLAPRTDHELPRRIVFVLWGQPLSRARIVQALSDVPPAAVDRALAGLIDDGRVEVIRGRTDSYGVASGEDRIVRSGWQARIGALTSLLDNVADVVEQRFFEGSEAAFARTVSFRVRPDDAARLQEFYESTLFPFLRDLEERARGTDEPLTKRLSLLLADLREQGT
jgi:hypothetical protein